MGAKRNGRSWAESEMAALEAETGESCRSLGIDPAHLFRCSFEIRAACANSGPL